MPTVSPDSDNQIKFSVEPPLKGVWTHASPLSCPTGFFPTLTNVDLPAGVPTSMGGEEIYLATAYGAGYTVTGCFDRRTTSTTDTLLCLQDGTDGRVVKWNSGGSTWDTIRTGLTSTATAVQWSWCQYGTDLFLSNKTDGVWRWDGDTLVPIGAKPIAQMESDEAGVWTGETADTTNFREGLQSMYVESSGSPATMTYTPAADFNALAGRYQASDYDVNKSTGLDFYHFKVMFSNTGTIDTTNTKVVLTDTAAKTLTWPYTAWDSDRSGTAMPSPPVAGTWYDVYLKGADATEVATFNGTIIDTFAFTVDTSAGTLRMNVDDLYVIYANTMPAVAFLGEWKNILFGANTTTYPDAMHFSPSQAPDEYETLATFPLKTRGESITGLKNFYSQLTVTADNTTHSLSGSAAGYTYPAYLFDQQLVSREHGCSSHRSIVEANNRLYWWYKGQIVEYRGTGTRKISYAVDETLDDADMANLHFIVGDAFRLKNQVWWTWRRSGQSANDRILRYDYINEAFLTTEGMTTPILYQTYSSGAEKLLAIDTYNRKVCAMDSSTLKFYQASDGVLTNITYTVDLPPLRIDDQSCEWLHFYLHYLTNTGTLTVQYRMSDHLRGLTGASYSTLESINQAVDGEFGRILVGDRSTLIQLRLTSTGVKFQVQFPLILFATMQGGERTIV